MTRKFDPRKFDPTAQRNFFESLESEHGFNAKQFAAYAYLDGKPLDPRQAYRLMRGEAKLATETTASLTTLYPSRVVADLVSDYASQCTDRLTCLVVHRGHSDLDVNGVDALQRVADFLHDRVTHKADGLITQEEKDKEIGDVKAAFRVLQQLLSDVVSQPVTERHQAKAPRLAKEIA
jgi:hypothetical protein